MAALSLYTFRDNLVWLLSSIICVAVSASITAWLCRGLYKSEKVAASCLEMLNEQDFSSLMRRVGYPEADRMIDIYNRMIAEMRKQRLEILDKSAFLNLLIEAETMGIVILDFDTQITSANPAAAKFLKIPATELTGKYFKDFENTLAQALSSLKENTPQVVEVDGINRYRCTLLSFVDRGFRHPFITIEELTNELIAAEKKASEKVIRTMSHEVNNTLSSINSNLSVLLSLEDCFPEDLRSDIVRALQLSIERSDHLCRLVAAFADIVKLPPPSMAIVSLNDIVQNTASLMQTKFAGAGVKCTLQLNRISPIVTADAIQLEQALINILKNALEACTATGGEVTIITTDFPNTLIVRDTGCGIPEEVRNKVFTPFFTTKPEGQGIGLMLVCEILLNHRFKFDLKSKDGCTEFRIVF
jgi:nitrogen fixation/metabolism regulation signal transduction histidine kinase